MLQQLERAYYLSFKKILGLLQKLICHLDGVEVDLVGIWTTFNLSEFHAMLASLLYSNVYCEGMQTDQTLPALNPGSSVRFADTHLPHYKFNFFFKRLHGFIFYLIMSRRFSISSKSRWRLQYLKPVSPTGLFTSRQASSFSERHSELISRRLPVLEDHCTPLPSILLSQTLVDFLPKSHINPININQENVLPFAHHLVYFPPATPLSSLLPDGTDPLHSPGSPFNRRMWAGGTINFNGDQNKIPVNAGIVHCLERIGDMTVRGREGEEKIFVQIERHIRRPSFREASDQIDQENRFPATGNKDAIELRNLVFIRDNDPKYTANVPHVPAKKVKPPHVSDISHILIPTPALLFRFSALTFNAHSIHLDKQYCRELEGHRNLLVHGPLSLMLMTEFLRGHLANISSNHGADGENVEFIREVEYKNIAPLYAEEELRLCARNSKHGEWELWIEGRDGGLAVRALAKTSPG